jgi:hypothetical protein
VRGNSRELSRHFPSGTKKNSEKFVWIAEFRSTKDKLAKHENFSVFEVTPYTASKDTASLE